MAMHPGARTRDTKDVGGAGLEASRRRRRRRVQNANSATLRETDTSMSWSGLTFTVTGRWPDFFTGLRRRQADEVRCDADITDLGGKGHRAKKRALERCCGGVGGGVGGGGVVVCEGGDDGDGWLVVKSYLPHELPGLSTFTVSDANVNQTNCLAPSSVLRRHCKISPSRSLTSLPTIRKMAKYALVSLPSTLDSLKATVADNGSVVPFSIPNFKIGTLDALVQQADDLVKLDTACQALVAKVDDSLRTLYDGDDQKADAQKVVNDNPALYSHACTMLANLETNGDPVYQQDLVTADNDVKGKLNQYNQVKTNFTALQRKQTGNLATKSLTPIVDPKFLVQDSEYLETHLIAVPTNLRKDFIKSYETLTERVVPRSAEEIAHDDEFILYAVTTFKRNGAEFQQKCREQKWTPRQYKHVEGGKEEEKRELERVAREEKKVRGEALRMVHTGWSESVMIWVHAMALRVFVESVLRYGLPLEFVSALVQVKTALDTAYSYIGGNAVGRDKRGKITKDDAALTSEMAAAGVGGHGEGNEYTAYVYYEFEL
ncbi:hypothetical protein FHL15_000050 [Xylaria flabelliformis]|uniref:V-type proton ATPase subunit C n=1 Tax=Xylaria flabelliformis TaxID=2512241 RepID=A0A553IET3_9PEZI|nr:hypothetical protein FHL15_000050 [Xylaria flabelliformis]